MYGMLKNMRIKSRLFLGFGIVLVLFIVVVVVSIINLQKINSNGMYALDYPVERLIAVDDVNIEVVQLRRATGTIGIYVGDTEEVAKRIVQINDAVAGIKAGVNRYKDLVNADPRIDDVGKKSRIETISKVETLVMEYKTTIADIIVAAVNSGDAAGIKAALYSGAQLITEVTAAVKAASDTAESVIQTQKNNNATTTNTIVYTLITIAVLALCLLVIIAITISNSISKPITQLVSTIESVANGNLNVNIKNEGRDEVAMLSGSAIRLIDVFRSLINDLAKMGVDHKAGEIDSYLDPHKYFGQYGEVAVTVNTMVQDHIAVKKAAMATVTEIVDGNFNADMPILPGKKIFINNTINALRSSIKNINGEVDAMISNSLQGKLSFRINANNYQGDWKKLMNGLNSVMAAVSQPVVEVQTVMDKLSKADFSEKMSGDYKGDFLEIKNSVNDTIVAMSSYVTEVAQILGEVSKGNLTKTIKREYLGSFVEIKDSINIIVDVLHKTMSEIASASDQVLSGAKQIANSSMDLAKGASIQASSIEELNASIDMINEQTQDNAKNAFTANDLSNKSTSNAKQGNKEMAHMLQSMLGIKESSNNISKIIKVIEDIAFQTNLLALNAAVEAARAGEHGKGFAVVADEVRNLAAKSQIAAKDTTTLIGESIDKVEGGTKTAQSTASALDIIVQNATEVSGIISKISNSSNEQAQAIGQISVGLSQISEVIQTNSATSEEAASASQELNSQAEMLKQMVSFFKL